MQRQKGRRLFKELLPLDFCTHTNQLAQKAAGPLKEKKILSLIKTNLGAFCFF